MQVLAIAEGLAINKRITSHGAWYASLPFGDPVRLKNLQKMMWEELEQSIQNAKANGAEDLPLQEAALNAANVIGMEVAAPEVVQAESTYRLPRARRGHQWETSSQGELDPCPDDSFGSRLHNDIILVGLVFVWLHYVRRSAGPSATGARRY